LGGPCADQAKVARERISARAADQLPHRNLDEYDRLRQVFEVFDTTPDVTVDTTQDLDALPEHVIATIRQQKQPHPAQASDS
jgi:hypothetical protein